jgi:hypothetical protein
VRRACKQSVPHQHGVDQFCSTKCREQYAADYAGAAMELGKRGFMHLSEPPNAFLKDGVSVTVEEVLHHGIDQVLSLHAGAVGQLAHPPAGG